MLAAGVAFFVPLFAGVARRAAITLLVRLERVVQVFPRDSGSPVVRGGAAGAVLSVF